MSNPGTFRPLSLASKQVMWRKHLRRGLFKCRSVLHKSKEVLQSKTRAKNKAKNTKEFCQIKSLITSLGASIDSQNCH